jgi:Fe-S-cluster containining protein
MPDKLITEIPLIARYSRHNENKDWRFRTFLKTSNMSGAELDATVQEITDEVWKQIDCTKCANCCKVFDVVVDDKDIKKLAQRFKVGVKQFEAKYVSIGEDKVKYFNRRPCPFLEDDNTCGVYEDRPIACRDFPYLHKEGFRQRTIMMVSNLEVCPIVFNVWADLKVRLWGRPPGRGRQR